MFPRLRDQELDPSHNFFVSEMVKQKFLRAFLQDKSLQFEII